MATAIEYSSPIVKSILASMSEANKTAIAARAAGDFASAADAHSAVAEMANALASIEVATLSAPDELEEGEEP